MSEIPLVGNAAAIEGDRLMDKPYGEERTQGPAPDIEELSRNMALLVEGAGKAAAAYLSPSRKASPRRRQTLRKQSNPSVAWPKPG
jgi:hypothetical protein